MHHCKCCVVPSAQVVLQFLFSQSVFYISQHWHLPYYPKWSCRVEFLFTGQPVRLAGDGRYDSPGHTARYCTYTFIDTVSVTLFAEYSWSNKRICNSCKVAFQIEHNRRNVCTRKCCGAMEPERCNCTTNGCLISIDLFTGNGKGYPQCKLTDSSWNFRSCSWESWFCGMPRASQRMLRLDTRDHRWKPIY